MATRKPTKLKAAVKAAKPTPARKKRATSVTRTASGRTRTEPEWQTRKRGMTAEGRALAERYDRVDNPLRGPRQLAGWWFVPIAAGGDRWWVKRRSTPATIGGFAYRPDSPWPRTTQERPGELTPWGTPVAPAGVMAASYVPSEVMQAAHFDPSSAADREAKHRRGRSLLDRVLGRNEDIPTKGATTRTYRRKGR
ncbi:MAG TPA: hypothetical protein VHA75_17745 [Rugosimonospora sp.]|nr:hypothetical protein [Rugosimonospora sp.]